MRRQGANQPARTAGHNQGKSAKTHPAIHTRARVYAPSRSNRLMGSSPGAGGPCLNLCIKEEKKKEKKKKKKKKKRRRRRRRRRRNAVVRCIEHRHTHTSRTKRQPRACPLPAKGAILLELKPAATPVADVFAWFRTTRQAIQCEQGGAGGRTTPPPLTTTTTRNKHALLLKNTAGPNLA